MRRENRVNSVPGCWECRTEIVPVRFAHFICFDVKKGPHLPPPGGVLTPKTQVRFLIMLVNRRIAHTCALSRMIANRLGN